MTYEKKNSENNAVCWIAFWFDELAMVIFWEWNYWRFSTSKFVVEITTFDTTWKAIARENVYMLSRVWNQFTVWTRAYEPVPIDDDQTTNIQQALPFVKTNTVMKQVFSKKFADDLQDETIRLENAKLNKSWWALTWLLQEYKWANIASATITDLATATWNTVHITWVTTITWFWILQAWAKLTLIFDWILTLTHNPISLILPTWANIISTSWDSMIIESEWSWNWKCVSYQRYSWAPLYTSASITWEIRMWATWTPPTGWLICDWSAISRVTYSALFAIINTTFWIWDWSTTFNLPNFKNRVAIWVDTSWKVVLSSCDSAWTAWSNVTATNDTWDKKEGTWSVKLAVVAWAIANQILWYTSIASKNLAWQTTIWFWFKSDIALNAWDLRFQMDDTASLASPIESINLPAIIANQWTKVYLTLATPSLDIAIISIWLYQVVDKGVFNIWIDDVNYWENYELWATWWSKTQTLAVWEIPAHNHTVTNNMGWVSGGGWLQSNYTTTNPVVTTSSNTWGGLAHNNLNPYMAINYIIAT